MYKICSTILCNNKYINIVKEYIITMLLFDDLQKQTSLIK